jgi:hypothetical protein
MERNAAQVFRLVGKMIIQSVKKSLQLEGVAKSEKPTLEPLAKAEIPVGWMGEVSLISLDFNKLLGGIIDQYILALNYMMLGKFAGKKAIDAAITLGLADKIRFPGMAYGAFLNSLDSQSEYYRMLEGKAPDDIPTATLEVAFKMIQSQVKKMVDESLGRYKNKMIDTVGSAYREHDFQNIIKSLDALQADGGETDHKEVIQGASSAEASVKSIVNSLREINESAEKDFARLVDTGLSMASSTGNFTGMVSLFGADGREMRACLVSIRDEKCCDKCREFSIGPDGNYKIYPLSAFSPPGSNYRLKQKDWLLTAGGMHPNCRCVLVYVPIGWYVNRFGDLVKEL